MDNIPKQPFARLWALLKSQKTDITSIYFYAILSGLVQLTVPIGVQAIIGFVLGAAMVTSIYVLIILVVIGVLLVGIFQINQMKIIEKIQQSIFVHYAFLFAEVIPRLDLKQADNNYLPDVINRFFDTSNVQKGLSKLLLDIPTASIQIIFGLLLLAFYHPIFIAFGALLIVILWLILKLTSKNGLLTSLKESSYKYQLVAWLEDMAKVVKTFKYSQGTNLNLHKTDKYAIGYVASRTAHFKVLLFQYKTLVVFKVTITTAMLVVGTFLLLNQQLNIGEFIAAEIVILTVINAIEKLIGSLDSVYDVITGLEKIESVTEKAIEKEGNLILQPSNTGIALHVIDCSFSYDDTTTVLHNINLSIAAKSKVCIVGSENSGKTTLLRILTGIYSGYTGNILINNIPLGNYTLTSVRNNTGILLNRHNVFGGTVWENISMGKSSITYDTITELAVSLGMEDFISDLPNGYVTELKPNGEQLSSTLIKKIILLRALIHKPSLLILKEPWSGLQKNLQLSIQNYLLTLTHTTVIVVSNDVTFQQRCDSIIEMENGKIKV